MSAAERRRARVLATGVLLAISVLGLLWALGLVIFGGFDVTVAGVRVRTHEPLRPLAVAALALAIFVPLYGAERAHHWWWTVTRRLGDGPVALGLAVSIFVVGLTYSSTAATGADSYGYVSQSTLWLTGGLRVPQPWVEHAPWPNAAWSFTPLGYRPAAGPEPAGSDLVPTYSPGLPLLMAAATYVAGPGGAFWIVPLSGALLVFMTYGVGRRLGSPRAGLVGAWFVATSPVVLYMLMLPMTDVPVAAAWASAFFFLLGPSWRSATAAGLASGIAILIRPNLFPLAGVLALWYLIRRGSPDMRRRVVDNFGPLLMYSGGAALGATATAVINWHLYGSPLTSGYGGLRTNFDAANLLPNFRLYLGWLLDVQTPLVLAGLAAVCVPLRRFWPAIPDRRVLIIVALFVFTVWLEYCAYLQFDEWTFLRFMLPSWPFLMLGMAAVALSVARAAPSGRVLAVAGVIICLGVFECRQAGKRGAFAVWRTERAMVLVAQRVRGATESNSVILSMFHSGSVRYYGGRVTLRYDWLDEEWLDRSLEWLERRRVRPYLLVSDWEIPEFLEHFDRQDAAVRVNRPPVFRYQGPGGEIFLFDLSSRPASDEIATVTLADTLEELRSAPQVPPPTLLLK